MDELWSDSDEEREVPDRIIRERACSSPTLRALSDAEERAWWRLTTKCDDYGRYNADPESLLSRLFEIRPQGWTLAKIAKTFEGLEAIGLVHHYQMPDDDRVYGHIVTFHEHQRQRESRAKFPEPPCGGKPEQAPLCGESRRLAASCGDSRLARARSGDERRESRDERRSKSSPRGESPQGGAGVVSGDGRLWGSPEALVELYNAQAPDECPAVRVLSPARRKKAKQYLASFPAESWWQEVFAQMHRSPFLRGLCPRTQGHESFQADFDWLLTKGRDGTENAVKVHDGRYSR